MERITSRTNPLISRLRRLAARPSARREEGATLGEGPKLLEEALRWGARLETVVTVPGFSLPPLPEETRLVEVPEDLLRAVAQTETPQGVLFVWRVPDTALPSALTGPCLVLDGVQDPGNVGTIWRTADAFGAQSVVLCPGCADPWGPKTVRATMGACFRLPVYQGGLEEIAAALERGNTPLYGAALGEHTIDVRQADLGSAAVIIGSEGRGVSPLGLSLCAGTVKIPMRPRCESLNAAVAAGVVLWEMARQG